MALAVNLQLASGLADADPASAKTLLEEMRRDVQDALDEAARLAQRIYPPLLQAGGLTAALRSAAASAPVPVRVDVAARGSYPPEVVATVYASALEVVEHAVAGGAGDGQGARGGGSTRLRSRRGGRLGGRPHRFGLDRLRDRIEALGGRVTIRSEPRRGTRIAGSLPLSR